MSYKLVLILTFAIVIGMAGENTTFKGQVVVAVKNQRPQWKEENCTQLADFILSQLETKFSHGITLNQASNIVEYLEHNLSAVDATPSDNVVTLNKEYYRWAIQEYVNRTPRREDQNTRLQKKLKTVFPMQSVCSKWIYQVI